MNTEFFKRNLEKDIVENKKQLILASKKEKKNMFLAIKNIQNIDYLINIKLNFSNLIINDYFLDEN